MTVILALQQPETRRIIFCDGLNCYRYIGVFLPMIFRQLGIIHAIEVVARQDQNILRSSSLDLEQLLADRIRCALA